MKQNHFFKQAELMLQVMPYVAEEKCFALKGGTAINFFVRDMTRLSVDIDLTYLPLETRDVSFLVYLISHDRPMSELLSPLKKDIQAIYENEFEGMTNVPITLKELIEARDWLIKTLMEKLTDHEKLFLLSMKEAEPHWDLLGISGIENLPAPQWKLLNIRKMDKNSRKKSAEKLKKILGFK